jgi:DNA-binding CsgD family transcriptional regulator
LPPFTQVEHLSAPPSAHVTDEASFLTPEKLPKAVAELARTDGWRAALELETAHWDRFVSTHPEALLASLRALPGDAFVEIPSLVVAVNYLQHLITGVEPQKFHDVANVAESKQGAKRQPLDRLIAATGRVAGHRTAGRVQDAAREARRARTTLDRFSRQDRAQVQPVLPHFLTQWGRAFELNDEGGIREYEEAWDLAQLTGQSEIARRAAASLAWHHVDHGNLNEAEKWIAKAKNATSPGIRYDAPLYVAMAMLAGDRLDWLSMASHLQSLEAVPIGEYWAAEGWARACGVRTEAEAVRVEALIQHHLRSNPEQIGDTGANRRYVASARARLAGIRKRPGVAEITTEKPTELDQIMTAVAAYRSGQMHGAIRAASRALEVEGSTRMQIAGHLLTAAARLSLGRNDAARDAFQCAHALVESERLWGGYRILETSHVLALSTLAGVDTHLTEEDAHAATSTAASSEALASLTTKERQMLVYLASDISMSDIAEALFVSQNTVKSTRTRLYKKLRVNTRHEAAEIAYKAGLA